MDLDQVGAERHCFSRDVNNKIKGLLLSYTILFHSFENRDQILLLTSDSKRKHRTPPNGKFINYVVSISSASSRIICVKFQVVHPKQAMTRS